MINNIEGNDWVFEDSSIDTGVNSKFDKAIDTWEVGELEEAEMLFKDILSNNPNHIDAYHHLSILFEENCLHFEAYLCAREAARIGLSVIPESFSWSTSKLDWGYSTNRPFLRAYHNLGLWLEKRKEVKEAIHVYKQMLSICPNDNLGVRYLLPRLCIDVGDFLSVIRVCKTYPDDYSPELMYTYSLALFLMGESEKAQKALIYAKENFPLVAKELKKKRHTKPKSIIEGTVTSGGKDEAYVYWERYGSYWCNSSEAMGYL